jgi:hypothetical protein
MYTLIYYPNACAHQIEKTDKIGERQSTSNKYARLCGHTSKFALKCSNLPVISEWVVVT